MQERNTMPEIIKKAQNLLDTDSVKKIDDVYYIRSSISGETYVIESDSMQCQCKGFVFRKECSHVHAVKMMQQK